MVKYLNTPKDKTIKIVNILTSNQVMKQL